MHSPLALRPAPVIPALPGKEGKISGGQPTAAGGADRFDQAWHGLRSDPAVQFHLSPPPAPPQSPAWLRAFFDEVGKIFEPVGRFFHWLASFLPNAAYARIVLWTVIILGAAAILWALYNRIRFGEWRVRLPRRATPKELTDEQDWAPDAAGARSWLDEADLLAREGRFAEAIHHLLFRSIEDISNRRPALVRPALTSRELAASDGIPARARELFTAIARPVERSLFGQREVGEDDWLKARQAYSDFALPVAWRA